MRSALTNTGSTRRWRRIRMAAIRRASFTCDRCHLQLSGSLLEVHHINGRDAGDGAANLLCVCASCHQDIEGRVPSWRR